EIDHQDPVAGRRGPRRGVDGEGRLADPALLVRESEDVHGQGVGRWRSRVSKTLKRVPAAISIVGLTAISRRKTSVLTSDTRCPREAAATWPGDKPETIPEPL